MKRREFTTLLCLLPLLGIKPTPRPTHKLYQRGSISIAPILEMFNIETGALAADTRARAKRERELYRHFYNAPAAEWAVDLHAEVRREQTASRAFNLLYSRTGSSIG